MEWPKQNPRAGHPWRPPAWQTQVQHAVTFNVILISICDGTGIPLLAMLTAIHHLKQRGIHITLVQTFTFENNRDSIMMARSLRAAIKYPEPVTEYEDLHMYPTLVDSMHIPANTIVFTMTGTPCTSISRGASYAVRSRDFGLHGKPSNLWWKVHAGNIKLQQRIGTRFVFFAENVVPANNIDLEELDSTAGYRNLMVTLAQEGASRARMSWTSIAYAQPSNAILLKLPSGTLPGNFTLDKNPQSTRAYPTLRTIIPCRLWEMAQPPHTMTKHEELEIKRFFIYNRSSQQYELPSMQALGHLMSVPPYVMKAFELVHPCKKTVVLIKHAVLSKQTCGKEVWCDGCCTIASALGSAWNASTTSRHIAQLFATYAFFHDFPPDWTALLLKEETFKIPGHQHNCEADCKFNRKHL